LHEIAASLLPNLSFLFTLVDTHNTYLMLPYLKS